MNVICRHCLKTNRIRKELRGKWTRCQFCNAEMEEPAPPVSKTQRKESVAVAEKPKLQTSAVSTPTASSSKSGSGFGGSVFAVVAVIAVILFYQHWREQQRIDREKRAAENKAMVDVFMGGASILGDMLGSKPKPAPVARPSAPLPTPPIFLPSRPTIQQTEVYDAYGNRVGSATTRTIP